jgi:3-hydroxyacyl-[acyl-carrier-protein] dehydratase
MRIDHFLLIDRIVELRLADRMIRSEATVPTTSSIFEGHFPGYPLMPGVLLIEAMAQTAGWLVLASTGFSRMPFLASIKQAKLRTFVQPGQSLALSAELIHDGSGYSVTKAAVAREGQSICDAEITFRVVDFPTPEFRSWIETTAEILGLPKKALVNG